MTTGWRWMLLALGTLAAASAQTSYMPVRDVRAGMRGTGYTVFSGMAIDKFDAEILGVLENAGPRQNVILAKLSGGPLEHTGVLQGMSGSPVYVNGKLIGAVALAFSLAKDAIAGIRPFEEMIDAQASERMPRRASNAGCTGQALLDSKPCEAALIAMNQGAPIGFGERKLMEISTPVSFSGFTQRAIEQFSFQLRAMGLEPRQGVSGGGGPGMAAGNPAALKPGSMISVQLVSGDMSISADGTVTHIDGKRIYAFGHRFLSLGESEMPFASAEVLAVLPSIANSFKISAARAWMGAITHDYSTAVRGELGRKPRMTPVTIRVRGGKRESIYRMEMVRDAALAPFLLQMTAFSALEATERTIGALSFRVRQRMEFDGAPPMDNLNVYSGEFNTPLMAAQSAAIPLAYAMQSGFREVDVKSILIEIDASPNKNQLTIEEVIPGRRTVKPGEMVLVNVVFASEGKRESRWAGYTVPASMRPGTLQLTVADGPTANLLDYRSIVMVPPRSAAVVSRLLNDLRGNTKAYLRVWRQEAAYQAQGEDVAQPPPSVANLYSRSQGGSLSGVSYTSKIAEVEIAVENGMVSGSKTVSVEIKD